MEVEPSEQVLVTDSNGVPIDLFVSKTKPQHRRSISSSAFSIKFTDRSSNLVFYVDRPPPPPRSDVDPNRLQFCNRLVSDSSGNPLIFISHNKKASWEGFSSGGNDPDPIFRVERSTNTLTRVEFQVFLKNGNKNSDFKMRGSPFYRSCTIYKGDSVIAQTSLMYKLGIQKVLVPRNRFRLTIFPGYDNDHAFIVALTVIFFYGRKLWI